MNRFLAILLVLSLPQLASAQSVSFGAKLDADGGHIGGNASGNSTPLTGRVSWAGNAITINSGLITGPTVWLEGTVTRSNDLALLNQKVTIYANPDMNYVLFTVLKSPQQQAYQGYGHVTVR